MAIPNDLIIRVLTFCPRERVLDFLHLREKIEFTEKALKRLELCYDVILKCREEALNPPEGFLFYTSKTLNHNHFDLWVAYYIGKDLYKNELVQHVMYNNYNSTIWDMIMDPDY